MINSTFPIGYFFRKTCIECSYRYSSVEQKLFKCVLLDLHGWIFAFSVSFLCIYFKSFYCCSKFCWCLLICFVIDIFRSQLTKSFLKVQSSRIWNLLSVTSFKYLIEYWNFFLNFTQLTWTFCDDMNLTKNIWEWCTYKGRVNRNRNMNIFVMSMFFQNISILTDLHFY